jgi:glycerol uptake facilitator protein
MSERQRFIGELIAEAVALVIIIAFGDSVAAMIVLYDPSPYAQAYWGVAIAWGLAVAMAIYTTGAISGCHANPSVTLALWLFRGFPGKKVVPYIAAQVVGAFVGAAIVYALYGPVIDHYNLIHHALRNSPAGDTSAAVFFTHPGLAITPGHAFVDEVIITALLVFGIFAITESLNTQAPMANGAFAIGLLVALLGACFGNLEAWPMSGARDFGPRLFAFVAGWGGEAIPGPMNYWWIPIVAPSLGGIVGGFLYHRVVRPFLPRPEAT